MILYENSLLYKCILFLLHGRQLIEPGFGRDQSDVFHAINTTIFLDVGALQYRKICIPVLQLNPTGLIRVLAQYYVIYPCFSSVPHELRGAENTENRSAVLPKACRPVPSAARARSVSDVSSSCKVSQGRKHLVQDQSVTSTARARSVSDVNGSCKVSDVSASCEISQCR